MKECRDCKRTLPLDQFSIHAHCKLGRNPSCKDCRNEASRQFYWKNRDQLLGRQRGRVVRYYRNHDIKAKYGLSVERYEEMLREQDGRCAICKGDNNGKTLSVDHCHVAGTVRGLLCHKCNMALGCMNDNIARLKSAAKYLERLGAAC